MGEKKHITQMTDIEQQTLLHKLNKIKYFSFGYHANEKIYERNINKKFIIKAIKNSELIEYHLANQYSHRILLRSKNNYNNQSMCIVVDLISKEIVTVYLNDYNDHHRTLDWSNYNKNLDILNLLKSA